MSTAKRFENIPISQIRLMTRLAIEHGAVNMAQGFPEFDPPPQVLEAASRALFDGGNQYSVTWGTPGLLQALADKYNHFHGWQPNPDTDITVTCGVSEAIMMAVLSFINPGDKVILIEPAHENYLPALALAGAQPLWVPLEGPNHDLNLERLEEAFRQGPAAIIVNTPHNPTGKVFDRETLANIAALCLQYNTLAITDEIYEHMVYDNREHIPLATLPGMAERTITISGLSKTYAATGWRIGWAIASNTLSAPMRSLHEYMTICAPTPLQAGAEAAVKLPDDFYENLLTDYTQRRDKVVRILHNAGFQPSPPQGAYYIMVDFSHLRPDLDDFAFANWLVEERKVAGVPGSGFYHHKELGRKKIRFAFPKYLTTLDRLADAFMT